MSVEVSRVGDFHLQWGESVCWDERRQRLYFVDCLANSILWLEHDEIERTPAPHTLTTPSMPTGLVPTEDGRIIVVLDDGLYLVDPDDQDAAAIDMLTPFPAEMGGRGNDACADLHGNLITGKLNLGPAEGSAWWFSATAGWRLLDPDIANTNGPAVAVLDGVMTLVIGDTSAHYYAYEYDPTTGVVGPRRVFGDVTNLDGHPDGATMDSDGGLWCALFDGAQLARFTTAGLDRTLAMPMRNPTDVTFGGPELDTLFVVSTAGDDELAGALLRVDGLECSGRAEPRFATR